MLIIIIKFLPCNIQFQVHYLWLQSGEELSGQFMVCMLWLSFNLPVQFVPLHLCSLHTSSFWLSVFEMGMTCIHYGSLGYIPGRGWALPVDDPNCVFHITIKKYIHLQKKRKSDVSPILIPSPCVGAIAEFLACNHIGCKTLWSKNPGKCWKN